MLNVLKYILLGLVQGIAEVLPISSSGHLTIVNELLKISDDSTALNVLLHMGSLIAVIIFLWKDLIRIIQNFFKFILKKETRNETKPDFMICIYLVLTTLVLVVFTIVIKMIGFEYSKLWFVGLCLIINAIMIFTLGTFNGKKSLKEMNLKDSIIIGLFQCAGSFAGISRSGSCLCGCKVRNIEKKDAAKFAFLLFIPATLGAFVLELKDISSLAMSTQYLPLYLISFLVAMVTTYFSFSFLKKIIEKGSIRPFSYYCATLGLIVFILGLFR